MPDATLSPNAKGQFTTFELMQCPVFGGRVQCILSRVGRHFAMPYKLKIFQEFVYRVVQIYLDFIFFRHSSTDSMRVFSVAKTAIMFTMAQIKDRLCATH